MLLLPPYCSIIVATRRAAERVRLWYKSYIRALNRLDVLSESLDAAELVLKTIDFQEIKISERKAVRA